jgi:hypothetical protein
MTGIARLAARDVPVVNAVEPNAGSLPNSEDAPSKGDGAFASILARAGDTLARSPAPVLADSRVASARFQGETEPLASASKSQMDTLPMQAGARSRRLEAASSGDIVTALVRHKARSNASSEDTGLHDIAAASGQRPHPAARGTKDSEVDQAPYGRETEVAAADIGPVGANVVLHAGGLLPLEVPKSEASDNTSGPGALLGLADDPAEQGAPTPDDPFSEAALRSHGPGLDAIGQVASSNMPTDQTAASAEIPDASPSGDAPANDTGLDTLDAVDPLARSSTPNNQPGIPVRVESSRTGTEERPPTTKGAPKPEPGNVAVDAAAKAPPIRPLAIGRETHFAPARPAVPEPFAGKSVSAETKSQIKVRAQEPEAPAHGSVASMSRDHRFALTMPPADPQLTTSDGPRSLGRAEGRIAPERSASDGRVVPTPATSDNTAPSGLPAGQLQRIADAVLASATGKPTSPPLDPALTGNGTSSRPLADGAVRTLVIKLDPPDYGTLTIRIRLSGKAMAVQFHAARSETARLLSDDRDKLSAAIETAGHELDISIVGAAPNPAPSGSSTDQPWLPGPAGGPTGSQFANPESERRPAPPPTHQFGDDRQFPHKDHDRDSHEAKPQDRRSGALYV